MYNCCNLCVNHFNNPVILKEIRPVIFRLSRQVELIALLVNLYLTSKYECIVHIQHSRGSQNLFCPTTEIIIFCISMTNLKL